METIKMKILLVFFVCFAFTSINAGYSDSFMHHRDSRSPIQPHLGSQELDSEFWREKAQNRLQDKLDINRNTNIAKNVIIFLGDGMSIPTITAARALQGQRQGRTGEGDSLYFEKFPYSGLSKTYCVDHKVADSACSSTAYLGGVKANEGTIGVNAHVLRGDCEAMLNSSTHVSSIAKWFQDKDLASGLVTTTRVTHASPAGVYAHVADRDWENDLDVINHQKDPDLCDDIARQLIKNTPGANLNVIMGGGRQGFLPSDQGGYRQDGENLIETWKADKEARNKTYTYAANRTQLLTIESIPDYILGLFAQDHIADHLRNITEEPTLEEMTVMAIQVLQNSGKGFFLFVEGGKIDLAHHGNQARIALDETLEFAKAIEAAHTMTSESDTLILVTADHAHTMSYSGYAPREESIYGYGGTAGDQKPYMMLNYANGPGYKTVNGERPNLDDENKDQFDYQFPTGIPLGGETHGGDDVAVFANGPWAHLFTGSFEENFIPHAAAYASCVGDGIILCK